MTWLFKLGHLDNDIQSPSVQQCQTAFDKLYVIKCYLITNTCLFVFQPTEAGSQEQLTQRRAAAPAAYSWSGPGLFSGMLFAYVKPEQGRREMRCLSEHPQILFLCFDILLGITGRVYFRILFCSLIREPVCL